VAHACDCGHLTGRRHVSTSGRAPSVTRARLLEHTASVTRVCGFAWSIFWQPVSLPYKMLMRAACQSCPTGPCCVVNLPNGALLSILPNGALCAGASAAEGGRGWCALELPSGQMLKVPTEVPLSAFSQVSLSMVREGHGHALCGTLPLHTWHMRYRPCDACIHSLCIHSTCARGPVMLASTPFPYMAHAPETL